MLNEIDRKIIAYLQYDGRMPYTTIASQLNITETTVRRRVKKLIERGKLQIVAVVKPRDLGLDEAAMIGISVKANRITAVADEIARLPEVTYLFQAAGEFDLYAEVYCRDREHFVTFLNDQLQQIPDIERTHSIFILKMHKLSYHWGESDPPTASHRIAPLSE